MEFDLINDMISDTISRFFQYDSQIQVIDDFRGLFSGNSIGRKTSSSIQLEKSIQPTSSFNLQSSSQQSFKNLETSPYVSLTEKQPQNQQQQVSQARNSTTASSINTSQNSSSSLGINNITGGNSIDSQKFNHVTQKNNLFDQSKQPLTPELWIQKEGANKLKEAQQRLNLNLSRVSRSDLEQMTLDQLTNEKKKVKQELKMYDASFQTHFNRFPEKQEKEPLRPLYIYYKKLKQFMAQKGQSGSVNDENNDDSNNRQRGQQQPQGQRQQNGQQYPQQQQQSSSIPSQGLSEQQQTIVKQIDELKKVRAELRDKLHVYQSEFFKNHNRKIRYHRDIQPIENELKQYKEFKQEIIRLESLLSK